MRILNLDTFDYASPEAKTEFAEKFKQARYIETEGRRMEILRGRDAFVYAWQYGWKQFMSFCWVFIKYTVKARFS